jgi:hypothetical protein
VRQQRKEQGDLNQSLREDFSSRGLLFNDVDQGGVPRQTARCLCQVERRLGTSCWTLLEANVGKLG